MTTGVFALYVARISTPSLKRRRKSCDTPVLSNVCLAAPNSNRAAGTYDAAAARLPSTRICVQSTSRVPPYIC